ncbi:GNAT family N-acetyltransferase [Gorillibacterium sp. CAU 1737]|uniref:GNAT family N-acetyltransferase n=1 Tax=Gorillibacterium sp. CAU 1737 TaxID=3140362 RepID=UPI003260802E
MIRAAKPEDASQVSPLLIDAIEDIAFLLTGTKDPFEAKNALEHWIAAPANRLSYENIRVAEADGQIVGMALMYAGARIPELDRPLLAALEARLPDPPKAFPEEACEDEFYLDSVAVSALCRGQGIGSQLIQDFERHAEERGHHKVSLIVDIEKPKAEALYRSLGYAADGERLLAGHRYHHMVKALPSVSI